MHTMTCTLGNIKVHRNPFKLNTLKVYDTNPQGAATCESAMSYDRKNNYIMQVANLLIIAVAALIVIGIGVAIFMAGIVSASPGEVKVISGRRGIRVLQGKTGWRVPFIERVDSMTASMVSIDVKTNGKHPY